MKYGEFSLCEVQPERVEALQEHSGIVDTDEIGVPEIIVDFWIADPLNSGAA